MKSRSVLIITPYLADANNGNWRTARRWQQLISNQMQVTVQTELDNKTIQRKPDVVIALHARRSHAAIMATRTQLPGTPLIVVLTGTDLYRDLAESADANESLAIADALIVLQEDAIQYVPTQHRYKTHVVFQSAKPLTPAVKPKDRLACVVVGHLRAEKSPETIFRAAEILANEPRIHIRHIGQPLDATLARRAAELTQSLPNYRWLGLLPHGLTRAAIKRAHLLLHPSIMEGGANVIVEAIIAGTAVVASRMSGNIGMLGEDYAGYFPVGDADALAALLRKCLNEPNTLTRLNTACKARSALFTAGEEKRRLINIINSLID